MLSSKSLNEKTATPCWKKQLRPIGPRSRHNRSRVLPLETAKTHINLAYTLGALWNRTRNRQALDEALHAVEAALGLIKETGEKEHIPAAELARKTILAAMGRHETSATAA